MTALITFESNTAGGIVDLAGRSIMELMETISFEEMAQRLRVSIKTVRKAVREGQLASIMVGKRRKVLRQPFEALLRSQSASTESIE